MRAVATSAVGAGPKHAKGEIKENAFSVKDHAPRNPKLHQAKSEGGSERNSAMSTSSPQRFDPDDDQRLWTRDDRLKTKSQQSGCRVGIWRNPTDAKRGCAPVATH